MRELKHPWFVEITRQTYDNKPLESIVIGPFHEKRKALKHMQDSADVDDWCYGEAKKKHYLVDDVFITKTPEMPFYGVNAPIF